MVSRRLGFVLLIAVVGWGRAQVPDAKSLLETLIAHEEEGARFRGHYLYLSEERSDRTGGHLWTERVAETALGRVRYLVAEDGVPLSADRVQAERARMADIVAHPEAFQKREQALRNDELHAKNLLQLLPKAFLFDTPTAQGPYLLVHFHPNPAYEPQSLEERVLHGMTGSFTVDAKTVRLHSIDGRLPEDIALGFGLLATIKAGSNFSTTRDRVIGDDWKTTTLETDFVGRAVFFKAISRKQHSMHSEFRQLPDGLAFAQAVALVEQAR